MITNYVLERVKECAPKILGLREILFISNERSHESEKKNTGLCKLNKELKDMIAQAKNKFCSITLPNFLKSSPQKFWRYCSESKEQIEEIVVDDKTISDPTSITDKLNAFFQSVSTVDAEYHITNRAALAQEYDPGANNDTRIIEDLVITQEGIFPVLLNLDTKRAEGPDGIPMLFLKRYDEWVSHFLKLIFERSSVTGTLPGDYGCVRE